MARKQANEAHPWQALEEQAFHAFREWPIWLALRERELTPHPAQQSVKPTASTTINRSSAKKVNSPATKPSKPGQ